MPKVERHLPAASTKRHKDMLVSPTATAGPVAVPWSGEIAVCARGKKELSVMPQVRYATWKSLSHSSFMLCLTPGLIVADCTDLLSSNNVSRLMTLIPPLCLPGQRLNTAIAKHDTVYIL